MRSRACRQPRRLGHRLLTLALAQAEYELGAAELPRLPAGTHPADVAFTLYALASAASQAIQLDEPGASARARRCMRALLGGA